MKFLTAFACGLNTVCAVLCYRAHDTRGMIVSIGFAVLTGVLGLAEEK
jgi:hypothetical protein